ncbi:MAG TPA: 2-phospho-L-lactate transferase CofD family protein, partial [Gammaproteobacteria bacterium]|nr:2-phospho-L-lactate transferase CofD family protein [Gammaproteobacteria bacterium]
MNLLERADQSAPRGDGSLAAAAADAPRALAITILGGGHGLAVVLEGLRRSRLAGGEAAASPRVCAVVNMADDGGSSGG